MAERKEIARYLCAQRKKQSDDDTIYAYAA
jgi:hypothetical protein